MFSAEVEPCAVLTHISPACDPSLVQCCCGHPSKACVKTSCIKGGVSLAGLVSGQDAPLWLFILSPLVKSPQD